MQTKSVHNHSGEHEVLRYVQANLNKLNITSVMYVSLTKVARTGNQKDHFIDSLEIKSESEFLTSSGTFFQSLLALYVVIGKNRSVNSPRTLNLNLTLTLT